MVRSLVESPWLWGALFVAAALMALLVVEPRYRSRQAQLERRYQARQRQGLAVVGPEGPAAYSEKDDPQATLRPLFWLLGAALAALAMGPMLLWGFRRRRSTSPLANTPSGSGLSSCDHDSRDAC